MWWHVRKDSLRCNFARNDQIYLRIVAKIVKIAVEAYANKNWLRTHEYQVQCDWIEGDAYVPVRIWNFGTISVKNLFGNTAIGKHLRKGIAVMMQTFRRCGTEMRGKSISKTLVTSGVRGGVHMENYFFVHVTNTQVLIFLFFSSVLRW